MTPLLFIFLPLCVIANGEQNCDSFEWTVIEDRATFEYIYVEFDGKLDPARVGAFTDPILNKVFYYQTDMGTIIHEIDHVKCIMENYTYEDRNNCHNKLDSKDRAEKSFNGHDPTPTPPAMSEKMKFQTTTLFGGQVYP